MADFWCIWNELQVQKNAKTKEFMELLQNLENMEAVAFLTDITSHRSKLNLKLQGKNDTGQQ